MAHGIEPLLPFDISEATYLLGPMDAPVSEAELLAARARQLQKRPEDLEQMKEKIWNARKMSAKRFEKTFERSIRTDSFEPGSLVLIRNSRINLELNRKTKQRYLGPYVVINRTKGGSYHLAELDGAILKGRIAAFRIVPYYAREVMSGPPIEPVEEQYSSDDEEEVEDAPEENEEEEEETRTRQ